MRLKLRTVCCGEKLVRIYLKKKLNLGVTLSCHSHVSEGSGLLRCDT